MTTNGSKRPAEILAEIDHTRHEMDRTLSAIEHRLTPGQLMDQGLDYLRHSGANEFVQNLGGTAKQNPVPLALVGVGLAWLMALGRQPAQSHSSVSTSGIRDKASGAMQSASETLSSAKERMTGSVDSLRQRAGGITDSTRQQWQRARGGIDHLVNEQPLALGAIGLAIGAVLGAAAPRTRAEEQVMGDAARSFTEKAKELGSQQLDAATQAAKQAAERVTAGQPSSSPLQGQQTQGQAKPQQPGRDKKGAW